MVKNKTIRLFVSSTFNDFIVERQILNDKVFPKVEKHCREHGFIFQVVDLRYGVPKRAGEDNSTMKICLEEVERCKRTGYYLNFLMLMGNRYGWNPAPVCFEKNDFEVICNWTKDKYPLIYRFLKDYYLQDKNQIPVSYFMMNKEQILSLYGEEGIERIDKLHTHISQVFYEIYNTDILEDDKKNEYFLSATGQEIWNGFLKIEDKDALQHVIAVFREMEGMKDYYDTDENKELALESLKKRIFDHFENVLGQCDEKLYIHKYSPLESADWNKELDNFEERMTKAIMNVADHSMQQYEVIHIDEQEKHEFFMNDRIEIFFGREKEIEKICDFVFGDNNKSYMLVSGERGLGKTSIMSNAIKKCLDIQTEENDNDTIIIYRFVAATAESGDPFLLLTSMHEQVCSYFGLHFDKKDTYSEECNEFEMLMKMVPSDKKLVMFVDAIDQISADSVEEMVDWIPEKLPENVKLIVSCMKDHESELEKKIKETFVDFVDVSIGNLKKSDVKKIITSLLSKENRRLTAEQEKMIRTLYESINRPIYLKYLINIVKEWNSYTKYTYDNLGYELKQINESSLSPDQHIYTVLNHYIKMLTSENAHGAELVKHTFGFLLASQNGISENEILGLLGRNDAVRKEYVKVYFSDNENDPLLQNNGKIPFMVWSRLYYHISNSLKEIEINGERLMYFYHLSLKDAVEKYICEKSLVKECHIQIAQYFADQSNYYDKDKQYPNVRRLTELPYQLSYIFNNYIDEREYVKDKYFEILTEDYIYAKCSAGYMDRLISEVYFILENYKTEIKPKTQNKLLTTVFEALTKYNLNILNNISYMEELHNMLVYRSNQDIHKAFFKFGTDFNRIYELIDDKNENRRAFLSRFISLQSEMKLLSVARRSGNLKYAHDNMERIEGENGFNGLLSVGYDYRNDKKLCKIIDEESARLYYELGYVNYLTGDFEDAVRYMDKSIECSSTARDIVGTSISVCVREQIKLYTSIGEKTEEEVSVIIDSMIKKISEVRQTFRKYSSNNKNASRWVSNTDMYLMLLYFLRDKGASDKKQVKKYYTNFLNNKWNKDMMDAESYSRYEVYNLMAQNKEKDCETAVSYMKEYVEKYLGAEKPWNKEFLMLDIYIFFICCKRLAELNNDNKVLETLRDSIKHIYDKSQKSQNTMGNMYFKKAIKSEYDK